MTETAAPSTGAVVPFVRDDGGRIAAGYRGHRAGDCVTRALAIATGFSYQEVYGVVNEHGARERLTVGRKSKSSARTGVYRPTVRRIALSLGGVWTPTMFIGQGCRVHLRADELPADGRHVLALSKHVAAWIEGTLRDTFDCSREGTRCVYGFWTFPDTGR